MFFFFFIIASRYVYNRNIVRYIKERKKAASFDYRWRQFKRFVYDERFIVKSWTCTLTVTFGTPVIYLERNEEMCSSYWFTIFLFFFLRNIHIKKKKKKCSFYYYRYNLQIVIIDYERGEEVIASKILTKVIALLGKNMMKIAFKILKIVSKKLNFSNQTDWFSAVLRTK